MPRFMLRRTAHCEGGAFTMPGHQLGPCPHCHIYVCLAHHACRIRDVTMPAAPPAGP